MNDTTEEERQNLLDANISRSIDPFVQYGTTDPTILAFQREQLRSSRGHARAATMGAFRFVAPPFPDEPGRLPKSYSISGDGRPSYLTPVELGRQELYTQVPFAAVFGLQAKERDLRQAFASYAANINVQSHPEWNEQEKRQRSTQASAMILDELEQVDSPRHLTRSFILAVFVATASQFSVGYNTGVMNAPEKVVFPGHSTALWSFAVAAFAVGGPFGAIVGGNLADSRGRRGALLIDIWAFMMGGFLQTFASDMRVIILSRFIIGFASGFSSVLVPIYLGELAPPRLRGALGTLTQFAMVIGIFVADLLAFPFATETSWRYLFAVTPMVAMLQILASPYLLESPRWLLNHDPKSNLARSIIQQLRGLRHEHEVEHEIGNYILGEAAQHQDERKSQYAIIREMVSHKKIRILLFSSLVLQMSQQFSGINAVFYYSTSFFEGVIDNPLVGTTIVGGVNVIATYIALLLMDSSGRRTLILWSSGGMFLSCVVIVLSLLGYFSNILALVAVNTYVTFFEIGLGPIPWLIVAEMFEGKYVATAMSLCSQLNWACNFVVGLVFPYMKQYLGPWSFGPFALILAFCFLYAWFVLPETQGTTPEQLIADIIWRNSQSLIFDSTVNLDELVDEQWGNAVKELKAEEQRQMKEGGYGERIK